MYQTWSWLAFLHWSYEPRVLQRLLPGGLRPHTFDGKVPPIGGGGPIGKRVARRLLPSL